MTEAEQILWSALRYDKLGIRFRRQYGVKAFVLDFYCPKYKLAIEVDGGIHETPKQRAIDKDRQRIIENLGLKFLRFSNEQVKYDLPNVVKTIRDTLNDP
jgi:very-short-patch-repair endonuclease